MADELTYKANDKRQGLTLKEIREILDTAERLGAGPDSPVRVVPNMLGRIKSMHITPEEKPSEVFWPVVSFFSVDRDWALPNLKNAPFSMLIAVQSEDASVFLRAVEKFAGLEVSEAILNFTADEFSTFMQDWEIASQGGKARA